MRCYEAQGQHGTTPEEGNVVTMLSNRADNVDRRAICKKGCQLRQHWCDSAFEYSRADCTGDGLLDHVCTRLDGSVLVQAAVRAELQLGPLHMCNREERKEGDRGGGEIMHAR